MTGRVISKNADLFEVENRDKTYFLKPSGKTKNTGIFTGDLVEFDERIIGIYPRKNILIRPPLANIDKMFITIAPTPKPDLTLVDKMIIYCQINDIIPVITINKTDMCNTEFKQEILDNYGKFYKTIFISAKENIIDELTSEINGICVLAGQSAVGKSSIINAIFKNDNLTEVGHLSKKTERGKQTTRIVKLYRTKNGYIADTAGFSLLDLTQISDITPQELSSFYPDFLNARAECKYRSCLHENGDCGVIRHTQNGEISKRRYEGYLKILGELKKLTKTKIK
jgi:ribosome biogenesis GTPase